MPRRTVRPLRGHRGRASQYHFASRELHVQAAAPTTLHARPLTRPPVRWPRSGGALSHPLASPATATPDPRGSDKTEPSKSQRIKHIRPQAPRNVTRRTTNTSRGRRAPAGSASLEGVGWSGDGNPPTGLSVPGFVRRSAGSHPDRRIAPVRRLLDEQRTRRSRKAAKSRKGFVALITSRAQARTETLASRHRPHRFSNPEMPTWHRSTF